MATSGDSHEYGDERRTARKRRSILETARRVFLQKGYAGTSMDEIAAQAAVSKQTVYKNFSDKQSLFVTVITSAIAEAERRSEDFLEALAHTADLESDLRAFAREHLETVLQPHLVQMRRVLIAEADRFPELARTWYQAAPERGHQTLAKLFTELVRLGKLRADDPMLAAQHFNWLVLSIPLNRAMFRIDDEPLSPSQVGKYADEGVRIFLAAYGAE
ncbi:MAG TPA: TetR/AcrR family transcriptional regulator [Jiangellaceae bacterium]|nr:TetR/AcrR family transcriptional regulator [Jiangellaceae bacterium]